LTAKRRFPAQFWLMFAGLVISTTGTSMIWPFITIYSSQKLGLPLTAVTSLLSINALTALAASIIAGSLVDHFGRKGIMTIGLFGQALAYLLYIPAREFWVFALLMGFSGLFGPLFRVGTDAMLADMFAPEDRAQAYALVRMGRNIGVALGPVLGGLVVVISYNLGLYAAAIALSIFGLITVLFLRETKPQSEQEQGTSLRSQLQVFGEAFRNGHFNRLVIAYTLMEIANTLIWGFLPVYLKTNFNVSEARYSWLPTTNALMVVFLQVFITRLTRQKAPTKVLPIGALFYAASMLIIALGNSYAAFWAAMVVMTIGEMIIAPTATVYVTSLAPENQRGRYLGVFGLTWNIAMSIGPLSAGILTDNIGMRAPYFFGMGIGILSMFAFLALDRFAQRSAAQPDLREIS
jgi:MFS family permease